jgi:hypothetical protein
MYIVYLTKMLRETMKELRTAGKAIRRLTSVLLVLSVTGVLAACKKVEADYLFQLGDKEPSYYSISNDTVQELSSFQYSVSVSSRESSYSKYYDEFSIIKADADGGDPSDWEYADDNGCPLDPEQEQFWIGKITSMDLPYTGEISVLYYKFDDYMIVYAAKWGTPIGNNDQITTVVFHNDEIIGTIDEFGLLNDLYKHN